MRRSNLQLTARYLRAMRFFGGMAIHVIWWEIILRKIGLRRLARRTLLSRYRKKAARFRTLAIRLGGIWIKVGQFLSARIDVLPREITDELAELQDEVPEEPFESMKAVIEAEFERPVPSIFAWIDPQPLASASLGQVHRARLPGGEEVVAKIQRPGIEALIEIDLRALRVVLGWVKRIGIIRRRVDTDALYAEFSRTVWEELDYIAEAANAKRFAKMFAEDRRVRIPKVHDEQTTRRVLTLEDVYFIKITDYASLEAAGINRAAVAKRLFKTYLHQIFEEGFFHADPHPGNLFVEPKENGRWRLVFVDFGMVGRLTPSAKDGLRELAIGVATRDAARLVRAYQQLEMLLPEANLARVEEAEALMFDKFWGLSMGELQSIDPREMHQFARQYRDLLYELPFQVPTDLLFLGRCIGILSGMCTGLDPDFNLFASLMPFARKLLGDGEELRDEILQWLEQQVRFLIAIPGRLDSALTKFETGGVVVTAKPSIELEKNFRALTRAIHRLSAVVLFFALSTPAAILLLEGQTAIAGALAAAGVIVLILGLLRA